MSLRGCMGAVLCFASSACGTLPAMGTVAHDGGQISATGGATGGSQASNAPTAEGGTQVLRHTLWVEGDSDHEGRLTRGALVDPNGQVQAGADANVLNSSYGFVWKNGLDANVAYTAYWFIDLTQSGVCELFPGDFVFDQAVTPGQVDDAIVVRGDDRVRQDLCAFLGHYALTLQAQGLASTQGKALYVRVTDVNTKNPIDGVRKLTISGDTAQQQWPALLNPGRSYEVAALVDSNGNGQCDSSDAQWLLTTQNPQQGVTLMLDTKMATASVCTRFGGTLP